MHVFFYILNQSLFVWQFAWKLWDNFLHRTGHQFILKRLSKHFKLVYIRIHIFLFFHNLNSKWTVFALCFGYISLHTGYQYCIHKFYFLHSWFSVTASTWPGSRKNSPRCIYTCIIEISKKKRHLRSRTYSLVCFVLSCSNHVKMMTDNYIQYCGIFLTILFSATLLGLITS